MRNELTAAIKKEKAILSCLEESVIKSVNARPFLKWAGGKQQLISKLEQRFPEHIKTTKQVTHYIEPFVGGGALFFYLKSNYKIEHSTIIDINSDLIASYKVVQNNVSELISHLKAMEINYLSADNEERKDIYYQTRQEFNLKAESFSNQLSGDTVERVAQLIFLNRTCFNGLYRLNSRGHFNVPQGSYKNPTICQEERLIEAHKALKNTEILQGEFELVKHLATKDNFIYYDPPYRPLNTTSNFTNYSKDGFNEEDQHRLYRVFNELNDRRVYQMLSNSDPKVYDPKDSFFDNMYSKYNIARVDANRMINSKGAGRGSITELLITNY